MKRTFNKTVLTAVMILTLALPGISRAHCDTLAGPVILDARSALEDNDVTPVLKWVRAEDESAIREAFAQAAAVRQLGPEAKDLADTYFFETLVRIHRAGEGAPFTGLKPGNAIEPAVRQADQALEEGLSVDGLAKAIAEQVVDGIQERFARAAEAKKHVAESVQAGREYVEAYVAYVHYVEGLANAVHAAGHHESTEHQH